MSRCAPAEPPTRAVKLAPRERAELPRSCCFSRVAVWQAARELEKVEQQIDAHEKATSAAQSHLQKVRGDLELGATGRAREQNYRGWVGPEPSHMFRPTTWKRKA